MKLRFYVANESARNEHGVLIVDDVSLHKNVRDLQEEIETDPLTRVMNRRGFELALDRRMSKLLGEDKLGLIYIDLDGFKAVNDTLGHKAGDQVLRSTATILAMAVRNADVVARLGGDEFAILVNLASLGLLENICKRIVSAFEREPLFKRILQNHGVSITCSLGVAIYPGQAKNTQEWIDQADCAMYEAKRSGKNCFRVAKDLAQAAEPEETSLKAT